MRGGDRPTLKIIVMFPFVVVAAVVLGVAMRLTAALDYVIEKLIGGDDS